MRNGLVAGAVGATALNAVTYADMALSGRAASDAPAQTVQAVSEHLDLGLSLEGSRGEAYGALAGAGTGVLVGVAAAALRRGGIRLPLLAEAAVIGAGAMVATDGPMHALGVSDLTTWGSEDWVRDAVPHYAYGFAVAATLRGLEKRSETKPVAVRRTPARPTRTVLAKAFALGMATGGRSSLGLLASAGAADVGLAKLGVVGAVVTEMVMDKQAGTPPRTETGPFAARGVLGAAGAVAMSRHDDAGTLLPALAGAAGAVAGTLGGLAFRESAAQQGVTTRAALVEDAVALALAAWAVKR